MAGFTYKGVDLSPFLKILEIKKAIGNERTIETNGAPKIGVNVQGVKFGAKIIKVRVSLASREMTPTFVDTIEYPTVSNADLNKLREKVTSLLHAESEFKLELPDEPDRFYMAIPRGDIELEGISDWYDETTEKKFYEIMKKEIIYPEISLKYFLFDEIYYVHDTGIPSFLFHND